MTDLLDPPIHDESVDAGNGDGGDAARTPTPGAGSSGGDAAPPVPPGEQSAPELPLSFSDALRPLLVAALATSGAALMTGGIFGSWTARLLGVFAACAGVGWSFLTLRSRNRLAFQVALVPVAFVLGAIALVPTSEGPTGILSSMTGAIDAGRLLRPPVPFDGGWRPILMVLFMTLGFGAGWLSLALKKPQLGLLLPVPILLLTAISQPAEGELIGSVVGFMPILLALGVLFGGDNARTGELGSEFELKRLIRSVPMAFGALAFLVLISQTDFLFPEPVYDPTDKPQKPKTIPLGEVEDRVLFEVDGEITGPWRVGVLDFYDGESWRLPPFDESRFEGVDGDGLVDELRTEDESVTFTVGDLGDSSVLPGLPDPVRIEVEGGPAISYDPRIGIFRVNDGRVPDGLVYTQTRPAYPTNDQLKAFGPELDPSADATDIPDPPQEIQALLDQAPQNAWDRLEFMRKRLNENVIAVGAGNPGQPVPPDKVVDLISGSNEGSPFEIVAAEAMIARWSGWPARIGFGFDGVNLEDGRKTIRPKNGSNWLEIQVEGQGWIPIIGAPPKAKSSLDADPNARFDPTIVPSDDVAVELLIPIKLDNLQQLYERIRAIVVAMIPVLLTLVFLYLLAPSLRRLQRRRKRQRWAEATGPRAQIAVEYAEFRDALYDLNVGDPYDTPLEYLQRCNADEEHEELAWLVTRATYGDLAFTLGEDDVDAASDMAESVRKRMFAAQPFQSRVLAFLSRESLRRPYTSEVPNVRLLRIRGRVPKRDPNRKTRRTGRLQGIGRRVVALTPLGNR